MWASQEIPETLLLILVNTMNIVLIFKIIKLFILLNFPLKFDWINLPYFEYQVYSPCLNLQKLKKILEQNNSFPMLWFKVPIYIFEPFNLKIHHFNTKNLFASNKQMPRNRWNHFYRDWIFQKYTFNHHYLKNLPLKFFQKKYKIHFN